MAKKRHTAEQIIAKLREAAVELAKGQPISKVVPNTTAPLGYFEAVRTATNHVFGVRNLVPEASRPYVAL